MTKLNNRVEDNRETQIPLPPSIIQVVVLATPTLPESKQVGLGITAKTGAGSGQACSDTPATSIDVDAQRRCVGLGLVK